MGDKSRGRHRKHQGRFHKGGGSQTGPLKIIGLEDENKESHWDEEHKLRAGMSFPDAKCRAWPGLKIKSEAKLWNVLNVRIKS